MKCLLFFMVKLQNQYTSMNKYILLLIPLFSFCSSPKVSEDCRIISLDKQKIIITKPYDYENYHIEIYPEIILRDEKIDTFNLYIFFPYDSLVIMPERFISMPQIEKVLKEWYVFGRKTQEEKDKRRSYFFAGKEEKKHHKKEMLSKSLGNVIVIKNHRRWKYQPNLSFLNGNKDIIYRKGNFRELGNAVFSLPGWLKMSCNGELNVGDTLEISTLYNFITIPIDTCCQFTGDNHDTHD